MKILHYIAFALTVLVALNWGLIGLAGADMNLVTKLLSAYPMAERAVYILIGLAGAWLLISKFIYGGCNKECK